jgi:hypothetical protein
MVLLVFYVVRELMFSMGNRFGLCGLRRSKMSFLTHGFKGMNIMIKWVK